MVDIILMSPDEIAQALAEQLKRRRLTLRLTQVEVAQRAGVSVGTVANLESKPQACALGTLIRIALALGLADRFENLFHVEALSIRDLERAEQAPRQRARRPRSP
jgi:transcriptional regulator with XRE-family HTH domain